MVSRNQNCKVATKISTVSKLSFFAYIKYRPLMLFLTDLIAPLLTSYSYLLSIFPSTLFMFSNMHIETQMLMSD